MKLPNADKASIPETKIRGYLLSPEHRAGKSKAAFFTKHGFSVNEWAKLADALRAHAAAHPVTETEETAYGTRYVVDGTLAAPDGTALNVRSIWFISRSSEEPRFATAHPLKRKAK